MVRKDAYEGICGACGKTAKNVEPDARKYTCLKCGAPRVYGAEEWLMM
jgi:DNA-directed RNA polymerase subunit RPC12/RpoP